MCKLRCCRLNFVNGGKPHIDDIVLGNDFGKRNEHRIVIFKNEVITLFLARNESTQSQAVLPFG